MLQPARAYTTSLSPVPITFRFSCPLPLWPLGSWLGVWGVHNIISDASDQAHQTRSDLI